MSSSDLELIKSHGERYGLMLATHSPKNGGLSELIAAIRRFSCQYVTSQAPEIHRARNLFLKEGTRCLLMNGIFGCFAAYSAVEMLWWAILIIFKIAASLNS